MKTSSIRTKQLVMAGLFIALSFVGANIKIMGSIAFDSLPAFLAAILLGPLWGAAIGFLGHMATALTSGFPLSLPLHMVVAISMALTMLGFGFVFRMLQNKAVPWVNFLITSLVGTVLNAPISLGLSMLTLSLMAGKEAAMGLLALLPVLLLASVINIVLAFILYIALERVMI